MAESEWDQRFSAPGFAYGEAPNDFLVEVAPMIPPGRVLSLAEGEGRNAVFLAARGLAVTAVDRSVVGLDKTRRRAADRGLQIQTIEADLATYAIAPGGWSGVVSIFCHLPPTVRRGIHRQVVEALEPGGAFVLEAYRPEQLRYGTGGPKARELLPTLHELEQELTGLELRIAREIDREIHEGRLHNGMSAVVQVLAMKPA